MGWFFKEDLEYASVVGMLMYLASNTRADIAYANAACLQFAKMPKMSPRTKHIGLPYHWFRGKLSSLEIEIHGISSDDQPADHFTKGLCREKKFEKARFSVLGW